MAKIGTAHVEIKPVLNEEALEAIATRIEEAIAKGVERGLASRQTTFTLQYPSAAPVRVSKQPPTAP